MEERSEGSFRERMVDTGEWKEGEGVGGERGRGKEEDGVPSGVALPCMARKTRGRKSAKRD